MALYTAPTDSNLRDKTRARGMRAHVRACCVSFRERENVKWRLHHKRGTACLALGVKLALRSAAVHRRREDLRWRSGLVYGAYRLQLTRRCARARHARVLCLRPRKRESEVANWRFRPANRGA